MKNLTKIASLVSLSLVVVPCLLYVTTAMNLDAVKWAALAGTIGWFLATPVWMSRELPADAGEVEI